MEVFAIKIAHKNGVIFMKLNINYVTPKMELTALIILQNIEWLYFSNYFTFLYINHIDINI